MSVASTTLEPCVWGDPRVWRLAQLARYPDGIYSAVARLGHLWGRCTFLGTDTPEPAVIVACLGDHGVEYLIESTLGEQLEDGRIRVCGGISEDGKDRLGWFRQRHPESSPGPGSPPGRAAGGKARASAAPRSGGRFVKATTKHQHPPATSPATPNAGDAGTSILADAGGSGSGSGSDLKISPARAGNAGDAGDQQPPAKRDAGENAGTSIVAGGSRARLIGDVWTYAQKKHLELRSAGIDPHAQAWSAGPTGTGAVDLVDRVRELAERGMTDEQIRAACIHVVDVRAAEARAFNPPHLRFFIASRTFTAEGFSKASELSPAQAAAQAAHGKGGAPRQGPRSQAPNPERPKFTNLTPTK